MAQPIVVMAFRKRLRNRGYRNISIQCLATGLYLVSAFEPLAFTTVFRVMSLHDMYSWH